VVFIARTSAEAENPKYRWLDIRKRNRQFDAAVFPEVGSPRDKRVVHDPGIESAMPTSGFQRT
jgi:hypothetical protein